MEVISNLDRTPVRRSLHRWLDDLVTLEVMAQHLQAPKGYEIRDGGAELVAPGQSFAALLVVFGEECYRDDVAVSTQLDGEMLEVTRRGEALAAKFCERGIDRLDVTSLDLTRTR